MPELNQHDIRQLNAEIGREIATLRALIEQIRADAVKRLDKHADTLEVVGRALDILSNEHRRMTTQIDRLLTGPEPLEVRLANLSHQIIDTGRQCIAELAVLRERLTDMNRRDQSTIDAVQHKLEKETQVREEDIKNLLKRVIALETVKSQAIAIVSAITFVGVVLNIIIKFWQP